MILSLFGWIGNVSIAAGLWGIGNKRRGAFLFSILGESCWIVKACAVGMGDLAFICIVFWAPAIRSYVLWGTK